MKNLNLIIAILAILTSFQSNDLLAQCATGEIELRLSTATDNWGNEGYWEIVPAGSNCGVGTIASGGNPIVGCNGGGNQSNPNGGYANNQTINAGPWCLIEGNSYDLIYIDDWGDGGFEFSLLFNGLKALQINGTGANSTYTFVAEEPLAFDLSVENIHKPYAYIQQGSVDIEGELFNYGSTIITGLTLNYSIDNGPVQSSVIGGFNISNYSEAEFNHPILWTPTTDGVYTIKVWATNLNGNLDLNPANDTATKIIEVGPGIPNRLDDYVDNHHIITEISTSSDQLNKPTDLDFHPILSRKELWVVNKRTENIGGSVVTYYDTGMTNQTSQMRVDGNAWHFMSLPTGIAFGENENFGTSPGVYDANHNGGQPFTGPSLWSSDPAIFAQPSGGNGSHLDMLHESPYSQGIAHEKDNAYWIFDGNSGDIVRYDFVDDHGPGRDYHADAFVHRYSEVSLSKDVNNIVVSHVVLDKSTGWLYIVDHGNARVIRLDINTGSLGGIPSFGPFEPLAEYRNIVGYTWEEVVTTGLAKPAGIDVVDDRMIVSDYQTGDIIIYDISTMPAVELDRIKTGTTGIMGVKIGPDGNIYYVNHDQNKVLTVRPSGTAIDKDLLTLNIAVYPNPNNSGLIHLTFPKNGSYKMEILNQLGQEVGQELFNGSHASFKHTLPTGTYILKIIDLNSGELAIEKLLIN